MKYDVTRPGHPWDRTHLSDYEDIRRFDLWARRYLRLVLAGMAASLLIMAGFIAGGILLISGTGQEGWFILSFLGGIAGTVLCIAVGAQLEGDRVRQRGASHLYACRALDKAVTS